MAGCNQFAGLCFDCLSADRDKHRLHADTDTQYLACQLLRIPVHGLPVSAFLPVCRFAPLTFLIAISQLFSSYESPYPAGSIFHAFFSSDWEPVVSTVALLCTSVLFGDDQFQIPVTQKFLCRTYRTLCALLALFRLCVLLRQNESLLSPFTGAYSFSTHQYGTLGMDRIISCGIITLISLVSSVHYFHVSYLDKVRTRIFLFFLIAVEAWIYLLGILQPQHFDILLQMQIIVGSILTGHLFTLTHNRFTGIFFIITFVLLIVLTIYNLWMQFFNS